MIGKLPYYYYKALGDGFSHLSCFFLYRLPEYFVVPAGLYDGELQKWAPCFIGHRVPVSVCIGFHDGVGCEKTEQSYFVVKHTLNLHTGLVIHPLYVMQFHM